MFYFDSLGRVTTGRKRKGQVVKVWDAARVYRFRVLIPDPERAKRFVEALSVMSAHAKDRR